MLTFGTRRKCRTARKNVEQYDSKCCCIWKKDIWLFKYWNHLHLLTYNKLISFAHAICFYASLLNDLYIEWQFRKNAIPRDMNISGIHSTQFLQQHFALEPDKFLFFSPHDNDGYIYCGMLWYYCLYLLVLVLLYSEYMIYNLFVGNV